MEETVKQLALDKALQYVGNNTIRLSSNVEVNKPSPRDVVKVAKIFEKYLTQREKHESI